MDILYNINIFQHNYRINGRNYKILTQLFINIDENHYGNFLILSSKNNAKDIILVAFDLQNGKLIPIPERTLNTVIQAIKQISFPDEFQEMINSLKDVNYRHYSNIRYITLEKDISAWISPQMLNSIEYTIELEIIKDIRLIPRVFSFAAFDGINHNIYFELENEDLIKIKDWKVLSGINIYIGNEFMGEYFLQRNNVINDNKILFMCKTKLNSVLESQTMIGGMKVEGLSVYENMDFILSTAGLFNLVTYPEGYLDVQKWYTVVIPIIGLEIEDEFGIGGVEFCTKFNCEIKRIIDFKNSFSVYNTYALVHINSEKVFTAFMEATKQIEQAIDLLVNILKDDSIISTHGMGEQLCDRNIAVMGNKVILSTLVYIESLFDNAKLWYDIAKTDNNDNLLVPYKFQLQKQELKKAELLLLKANGTNDKEITPLFNSLKWIRKSWDTNDFDDKIINAIIALEFIVSKEKNVEMMDKSTRKKCKEAIKDVILEKVNLDEEGYLKNIFEKFDRAYTETPFMLKLTNLINRLNIPISKDEFTLISNARKQRNGIIHGKDDMILPTDEVFRLLQCISKIAFYKINSLEV